MTEDFLAELEEYGIPLLKREYLDLDDYIDQKNGTTANVLVGALEQFAEDCGVTLDKLEVWCYDDRLDLDSISVLVPASEKHLREALEKEKATREKESRSRNSYKEQQYATYLPLKEMFEGEENVSAP